MSTCLRNSHFSAAKITTSEKTEAGQDQIEGQSLLVAFARPLEDGLFQGSIELAEKDQGQRLQDVLHYPP